jgi:hypothetical protein
LIFIDTPSMAKISEENFGIRASVKKPWTMVAP